MDRLTRYRAWIIMAVVLVVVVLAVSLAKGTRKGSVRSGGDVPNVSFGSQVQPAKAANRLIYTNGWLAQSGGQRVGVYAGLEQSNRRNGLFVILRRDAGKSRVTSVAVRGSGALTLLRPSEPSSEQAAFTETLRFVTANGDTGTLSLSGDHVTLNR